MNYLRLDTTIRVVMKLCVIYTNELVTRSNKLNFEFRHFFVTENYFLYCRKSDYK